MAKRKNKEQKDPRSLELSMIRAIHLELRNLYRLCSSIVTDEQEIVQALLQAFLERIQEIRFYPRKRLELLAVCYGIDSYLFMHGIKPSDGWQVLYDQMNGMFAKYAPLEPDGTWVCSLLVEQLQFDPVCWHIPLLQTLMDIGEKEDLARAMARLLQFARNADERFLPDRYLVLAGSLAKFDDQFDQFIDVVMDIYDNKPSVMMCLYIADSVCDGEPDKAVSILEELTGVDTEAGLQHKRNMILRDAFHQLGNVNEERNVARAILRSSYSLGDARRYFDTFEDADLQMAVEDELRFVHDMSDIHPGAMLFLSYFGTIKDVKDYVLGHIPAFIDLAHQQLDHVHIVPFAMNLEEHGECQGATVLYRVLVLNLLAASCDSEDAMDIQRCASYLVKLDQCSKRIRSWKAIGQTHAAFMRLLKETFGDKAKIWSEYQKLRSF